MNYEEMSDEEFYKLSPEEHEKYLIESHKNIRKIEILEKLEFSKWTKEELIEVIIEYELIKLAQEKMEKKKIELTTISKFVQDGIYKRKKFEFEEYKILEATEEMEKELKTGNRRKLRPCIVLRTLALGDWTRRELLDLIQEYDEYIIFTTTILKSTSLSVLNYIIRRYCGCTRRPFDQYDEKALKKFEQHHEILYRKNVSNIIKEKMTKNPKFLRICMNEENFIIMNRAKFIRYAMQELNKLGYNVYSYGEMYKLDGKKDIVKDDEVLAAIHK